MQTCALSLWVICHPMLQIRSFAKFSQYSVLSLMWRLSESHLCMVHPFSFPCARVRLLLLAGINVFAFIQYLSPDMAVAAVQASPRMYGVDRLRVERKEFSSTFAPRERLFVSGGSPGSPYFGDSHEQMSNLLQRIYNFGITQGAQTQAMPPPVYAPYPYYQPYDLSQYGQYPASAASLDNNTAAGVQTHGNGYPAQAMGHFQYSQPPNSYLQYPQQPAPRPYQWPPANGSADNDNASSSKGAY